ncbi:MAG: hypothetical protein ACRC56_05200, partial [Bosea sp. (in: a-proteobacteria)]
IGIHGLNDKPSPPVLKRWWRKSIQEGLARNCDLPRAAFDFELAYWADLEHAEAVEPADDQEPYVAMKGKGPLARHSGSARRKLASLGFEGLGKFAEVLARAPVLSGIVDEVVEKRTPDLFHYQNNAERRQATRDRLLVHLRRAQKDDLRTMLIAHSMGSIIAFDVLLVHPELKVDHLVTVGSPLGLAEVKSASRREFGRLQVPEGVGRWDNFSDQRDPIAALDMRLASDFPANSRGVKIADHGVHNQYVAPSGKANPHKIYGYLRTPEVSVTVAAFLEQAGE